MKILSSLLIIASFLFSSTSLAVVTDTGDCQFAEKLPFSKELGEACKERMENQYNLVKKTVDGINKDPNNTISNQIDNVISGKNSTNGAEFDVVTFSMIKSFVTIGIVTIFVLAIFYVIPVIRFFVSLAANKEVMGGKGAFATNLFKSILKMLLSRSTWITLVGTVATLGFSSFLVALVNVHNTHYTLQNYTPDNYRATVNLKAQRRSDDAMKPLLQYAAYLYARDKSILYDESLAKDFVFDPSSKYYQCMKASEETFEDSKSSLTIDYLKNMKACGRKYASIDTMKAGNFNFKLEEQQKIKSAFISVQFLIQQLGQDINDYYCANQVIVTDNFAFRNQCFMYDVMAKQVVVDGQGKPLPVTKSKSFAQIKDQVKVVNSVIAESLKGVALEHLTTFVPEKQEIGLLSTLQAFVTEGVQEKKLKENIDEAMDFDFKFTPEFQFNKLESQISDMVDTISGGKKTTTDYFIRIDEIIDSLTAKSQNEVMREIISNAANFVSSDYLDSLGMSYNKEGSYNVLATMIASASSASEFALSFAVVTKSMSAVYSLSGTKSLEGRPDLKSTQIELIFSYFGDFMYFLALILIAITIRLIVLILKSVYTQFYKLFMNYIKIALYYDLSLLLNLMKGERPSYDEITQKILILLYVFTAPLMILFSLQTATWIVYVLTDVTKENIFDLNSMMNLFNMNGGLATSFGFAMFSILLFQIIIWSSVMIAFTNALNYFDEVTTRAIFGSQDRKNDKFLREVDQKLNASSSAFDQAGRKAREARI